MKVNIEQRDVVTAATAFARGNELPAVVFDRYRHHLDFLAYDGARARKVGVLVEGVLEPDELFSS